MSILRLIEKFDERIEFWKYLTDWSSWFVFARITPSLYSNSDFCWKFGAIFKTAISAEIAWSYDSNFSYKMPIPYHSYGSLISSRQ